MSSSTAVRQLASDPLWLALCPTWTLATTAPRRMFSSAQPRLRRPRHPLALRRPSVIARHEPIAVQAIQSRRYGQAATQTREPPFNRSAGRTSAPSFVRLENVGEPRDALSRDGLEEENTLTLYTRLHALASGSQTQQCRQLAEYLVRERREKPNSAIYNALILSNISHSHGAAWRVAEYLDEMRAVGFPPDISTCHAVLKVLSVHPDHLLRSDILHYMKSRWFELTPDGSHDVAAGLLREGLYEQALERLEIMQHVEGLHVQSWLLDLAVYTFCSAGEVDAAYQIMQARHDAGELTISRNVWHTLLDTASDRRHHAASSLVWHAHVRPGYINPSSGVCLNILSTAACAGDPVLATDVFAHLSKRGTAFTPSHYGELVTCYLSTATPDLHRALAVLTIMALEKKPPAASETRDIYLHIRKDPALVQEAFTHLRALHSQGRLIPIAALNLLIECHIEQDNLAEAMRVYKLIHTFAPLPGHGTGSRKSFANAETFNLLLRGCRQRNPPDAHLASFLVAELLALRVRPSALTYDRLILVFVEAAAQALAPPSPKEPTSESPPSAPTELSDDATIPADAAAPHHESNTAAGSEYLDWAVRHFSDMQDLGWMPRFGTIERMAVQLAKAGDERCWDILQAGEDRADTIEGWESKGRWARRNVEQAWDRKMAEDTQKVGEEEGETTV